MIQHNKVTIHDVAKIAGVSITTVSRVINNNYPVKEATRKKVEEAIENLKFSPNLLAKGLINNKTYTIGVIVPSIANLFFPAVIKGIECYMKKQGYIIFLTESEGLPKEEQRISKAFLDRQVDGIIIIDPRKENIKNGFFEDISTQCPTVLINGYNKGIKCDFVLNDQEIGTVEAINYLIENGHKNIGFIRGSKSYSYDLKEEIYFGLMKKNNLKLNKENIITIEDGNSILTSELSRKVIIKRLKNNNNLTAIFACNDSMAVGVINGAKNIGLKVPDDLSVIGYDNTIISEMIDPKLTTVDQNMYKLGEVAAKRLNEIIESKDNTYTKTIINTKLILRESVRRI